MAAASSQWRRRSSHRRLLGALILVLTNLIVTAALQSPVIPKNRPIDGGDWPDKFPAKEHCSRCGLCETTYVSYVKDACAFLTDGMSNIDPLVPAVHETASVASSDTADHARFGTMVEPIRLAQGSLGDTAQWTGVVTGIALSMLETNQVDAVVCIGNDPSSSWSTPLPVLAKTPEDVLKGRGVKPSLAPTLAVLDQVRQDPSIRRLLVCGVGCAVQALRTIALPDHVEELFVLGTNCADNSPTPEAATNFVERGILSHNVGGSSDNIRGYEFAQDYRIHVEMDAADDYTRRPYFCLPGTLAEPSIAKSCLSCFDYANALADVVVGYMGAPLNQTLSDSWQTLTIRNGKGKLMVDTAIQQGRLHLGPEAGRAQSAGRSSYEPLVVGTLQNDALVQSMLGQKVAEKGMPDWLGEIMATWLSFIGPKELDFARYSIDYHLIRNYFYLVHRWGKERAVRSLPKASRDVVDQYLARHASLQSIESQLLESRTTQKT